MVWGRWFGQGGVSKVVRLRYVARNYIGSFIEARFTSRCSRVFSTWSQPSWHEVEKVALPLPRPPGGDRWSCSPALVRVEAAEGDEWSTAVTGMKSRLLEGLLALVATAGDGAA